MSAELEPPLGALGRVRVEVDSRMKEFEATGPVLNAGPMAAFTVVAAARTERISTEDGIVAMFRSTLRRSPNECT